MQLNPYLNFGGNCAEAFRFYEQHLGGKITMTMPHGQGPCAKDGPLDWKRPSDPVPTLSDAVKKYGLRIETRKVPVEMFILTHIDKTPTEN